MAIQDITKPMALDETLQATNTALGLLGKDTTLQSIVTALAGIGINTVGNLASLVTADKTSLVGAVNEVAGNVDDIDTAKADKVSGATNGNLASLDDNGNLTDSGWKSDKTTTAMSGNPISISGLKSNQLAINPIITLEPIQAGSGDPSPSNIRAISGYDKIEVLSCGKNLVDPDKCIYADLSNGNISSGDWLVTDYILVRPNTQYVRSSVIAPSYVGEIAFYSINKTFISRNVDDNAFTTPSNCYYLRIEFAISGKPSFVSAGLQLELGSQATTFEPYHKTTDLSEALGQTVYAGTYNPRTGIFTATHGKKRLEGNDTFSGSNVSYNAQLTLSDMKSGTWATDSLAICDSLEKSNGEVSGKSTITFGANNTKVYLFNMILTDPTIDSSESLNTYLANHPIEFIYPLATPIEIQLTPHEISLLKDYAYISTNGTSIALDYHNGELASLGDVSQLGETVNELANALTHTRLNVAWGNVSSGTTYSYDLTQAIPDITVDALRAISIMCAKGASKNQDAHGIYNYRMSSSGTDIVLQYHCALTQNSAVSVVDVLYQS